MAPRRTVTVLHPPVSVGPFSLLTSDSCEAEYMKKAPFWNTAGACTGLRPSRVSRARRGAIALAALLVLARPLSAMAQSDVADARDHEQIPRYEGSWILGHETKRFDRFALPTGPAVRRNGQWQGETEQVLEGSRTRLLYVAPQERSKATRPKTVAARTGGSNSCSDEVAVGHGCLDARHVQVLAGAASPVGISRTLGLALSQREA